MQHSASSPCIMGNPFRAVMLLNKLWKSDLAWGSCEWDWSGTFRGFVRVAFHKCKRCASSKNTLHLPVKTNCRNLSAALAVWTSAWVTGNLQVCQLKWIFWSKFFIQTASLALIPIPNFSRHSWHSLSPRGVFFVGTEASTRRVRVLLFQTRSEGFCYQANVAASSLKM